MTPKAWLAMLALVGACGRSAAGEDDPPREPPAPPRFEREAMVKFHMQRHFDDLRNVERLLIAGKLEDATSLAYLLTKPANDPGMAPWAPEARRVTEAARALVSAPSLEEACRLEARVAAACADCHLRAQKVPVFAPPPAIPPDQPTYASRMARHEWAADRLWEGMVGGGDEPWRRGLEVFAQAPLPFSPMTDAPALASRIQTLAKDALATRATDTMDDRARTYGEILVRCVACHQTLHAGPTASR